MHINERENGEARRWTEILRNEGYSKAGAKSAAEKIVGMDAELRVSLQKWLDHRELDHLAVDGISLLELTETLGYREIAAFLILDWLKREPDKAKEALCNVIDKNEFSDEWLEKVEASEKEDAAANPEGCGEKE